jgi:hypothetical protein
MVSQVLSAEVDMDTPITRNRPSFVQETHKLINLFNDIVGRSKASVIRRRNGVVFGSQHVPDTDFPWLQIIAAIQNFSV